MRGEIVKVIDPRGTDAGGEPCRHGDLRYDLGKLHHSAVGQYDHIIAGNFRLRQDGPLELGIDLPSSQGVADVAQAFLNSRFSGMTPADAAAPAISVLLFLSMLPLHADDAARQRALLANSLRLFVKLDRDRSNLP